MKNILDKVWGILMMILAFVAVSCEDVDDLATPNVASPVLVLLDGSSFPADASVGVTATFMELDKSGILDHTVGIDSIPVSDLQVLVYINQTEEVSALVTDGEGKIDLSVSWEALGLSAASSGDQVRLEFAGTHKNVSFRKYHTVRVD
ncbi:hypothetical protein [Echinicola sp. 20G]|uniref:hypothetical protein n=1 Tax=Echinicola sp. 20G TaxID=2781961 RepID=UPI001F1AB66C|nr:hypothetical protein [Echinicola sp. 20G]